MNHKILCVVCRLLSLFGDLNFIALCIHVNLLFTNKHPLCSTQATYEFDYFAYLRLFYLIFKWIPRIFVFRACTWYYITIMIWKLLAACKFSYFIFVSDNLESPVSWNRFFSDSYIPITNFPCSWRSPT